MADEREVGGETNKPPYPYVRKLQSGLIRELKDSEKAYLETDFHPGDSGRPYIMESFKKNDYGFIARYMVPKSRKIWPADTEG